MSSFVLSDENFKYFKEKITKLLMSESYIRYNLKPLKQIGDYSDKTVRNYIDKQVDDLQYINAKSVMVQYGDEKMVDFEKQPMPLERQYYEGDKLTEHETLQLINNLNCLNYQIEMEFDDYFLKTVTYYAMQHLVSILIEKNHDRYDYNSKEYIQWGF